MNREKSLQILVVLTVAMLTALPVLASYTIWSNPVNVNIENPSQLDLTVNGGGTSTTLLVGSTLTLTAHIFPDTPSGIEVYFYDQNANFLFGHNTTVNGYATLSQVMTSAGQYVFNATCIHP